MSSETTTPADEFDVDVSGVNPDAFERQMADGNVIPAGFYRAFLNGAVRGQTKGDPGASPPKPVRAKWDLTFKIEGGVYDGREVEDSLFAPQGNKVMENRVLMYKHRLGLIRRAADGKSFEVVAGKKDFQDCMDTKVIIHVKHETFKKKDGTDGVAVRLDFSGLHAADDPKAVEKIGKPVADKSTTPSGGATAAAPAKKQFDVSQL